MSELIFLKLGGSLITDKTKRYSVERQTLNRLAQEIAAARAARPDLRLVVAHGSGSFGHVAAEEAGYDPQSGYPSVGAFAQVSAVATALNAIVRASLLNVGVPAVSLAPSASALAHDNRVVEMAVEPFRRLLEWGGVPLTFGDVALRKEGGGVIISTEAVFQCLGLHLRPNRLILLGQTEGVYASDPNVTGVAPQLIREITPQNWGDLQPSVGGSHGRDVTGGMRTKVAEMIELAQAIPGLEIRIVSGKRRGLVTELLLDRAKQAGSLIRA